MHGSGTVEMYGVYFHTNCQQDDLDSQSLSGTRISTTSVWETHQNCGSNSNPDPGCIFTSQNPWTGRKTNYCSGGGCDGQLWTGIAFDSCTEIGCIKFRSNYGYFPTSIDVQRFTSEGWTTVHSFECADGRRCNDGPEEIPTGQSECGTLSGEPATTAVPTTTASPTTASPTPNPTASPTTASPTPIPTGTDG